jgi:hypothetical protein
LGQIKDSRAGGQLVAALSNPDPGIRQMAISALGASAVVIVDQATLSSIDALGSDFVFFVPRDHPITRLSEITDPATQFAVAEFSQKITALRFLLWGGPGGGAVAAAKQAGLYGRSGVEFGTGGTMRPLGVTYQSTGGTTIMGIGDGAFATLFQDYPQLRLFVATRGTTGIGTITTTGGGVQARLIE